MRTPHRRRADSAATASQPGRRVRGNPLRRHWLTGALITAVGAVLSFAALELYEAKVELQQALQVQAQVEAELKALQEKKQRLSETLERVTSDESMELKAKQLGFTWPDEQVYQTVIPGMN